MLKHYIKPNSTACVSIGIKEGAKPERILCYFEQNIIMAVFVCRTKPTAFTDQVVHLH